jgi:hypothetical protein
LVLSDRMLRIQGRFYACLAFHGFFRVRTRRRNS